MTAAEAGIKADTALSLADAEAIALRCLPSVAQARAACSNAVASCRQTEAGLLPSVDASAGYRRSTSNTALASAGNDAGNAYSAELGLDQLVFDFGATPARVRQARLAAVAAEQSLRAAEIAAVYGVRVAFFALGKKQELLRVAEESVRQFEVRRDQIRTLVEVGRRIKYDLTKAEVDLGNARLDRIKAANGVAAARSVLNRSLGLAEDPSCEIAAVTEQALAAAPQDPNRKARESHPELLSLQAEVRAASAGVDAAIGDLYPSLGFRGSYTWSGSDFPLVWNWGLGLNLAAPLFSGWRRTSAVDGAVARLRLARAGLAAREQQLHSELTTAVSEMDSARQRAELGQLIVKQAAESLDLIRERYRVGQAALVELTDAQVALSRAQADEAGARFDWMESLAKVHYTAGGQ